MSEEILKALMQLFAIITKQDEGVNEKERKFIENFLRQQLSADMVGSYLTLYESFLGGGSDSDAEDETKKKKLTSVKDSVKTLSICKKINKTLTQKQKIIVLIRLFELIDIENKGISIKNQKFEIIDTVSTVFNILPDEFKSIEAFCRSSDLQDLRNIPEVLLVASDIEAIENGAKIIHTDIDSPLAIIRIPSEDMYFLRYLGKSSILLNGQPVNKNQVNLFAYGSSIKPPIGEPIYYSDIHSYFLTDMDFPKISFQAKNIGYNFANGNIGLRDINIQEGPGKLIAIMGGSGAGKTTLLNVLAGLEYPSKGEILINGLDIIKDHKKVEGVIGYVAQDDILFEELTVYQNLYYNAKLCFKNLSEAELIEMVHKTLRNLGLFEIKEIKVGNVLNKKISGGQRKRLNIALELIREPAILFLDEPTSGLSSRDSENVIDLLKELTLKGKLIFVVIHQPSSDIYKMFDKVIILDSGGYQIYYGNPVNAVIYFKQITNQINAEEGQCAHCGNVNPEQIFNTIDAKVVDEYGNLTETRKISSKIWNEFYNKNSKLEDIETVNDTPPKSLSLPNFFTQFMVFTKRDVLSKVSNMQYVLINLLEAPVLAFLLSFIIRYIDDPKGDTYYFGNNENIPAYLFMSIIVALFMGLTVSAEEIIRDAKIRKRENFLNLNKASYFGSKIFIMFCLSAIQTLLYAVIGNSILGIKDMTLSYWLMLFTMSCTANLMGLNISATFNSAVTIYILIPLLLIPQMILSGAIFSFDKLNRYLSEKDKVPIIADMMASRWGYEGIAVRQFKDNKFEKVFYGFEQNESREDYKSAYWAPKLLAKIDECKAKMYSGDPVKSKILKEDLELIKYELFTELSENKELLIDKEDLNKCFEKFDVRAVENLKNTVNTIKSYYERKYLEVNGIKDQLINKFLAKENTAKLFNETKKNYYNESLADIVKNVNAKNKIIEYHGKLVQIKDPVYLIAEPTNNPLDYRSHLYAPQKHFFGKYWDTFWFNICVVWFFTFILSITLYFEFFKNLFGFISKFGHKNVEN
ncbi:MAG: ATP-binding cassette domain-containing protein [Bacteroidota bacterium]|nr:ATP-binding cassette domain-containing protein [Bacteroidota bacterium]